MSICKTTLINNLLVSCLLCFQSNLAASPASSQNAIKQTVASFYQAVASGDCKTAVKLRIDYLQENCQQVSAVKVHQIKVENKDKRNAVVLIETDITSHDKKHYFRGYTRLRKLDGSWFIVGPYKNSNDYTLDEYLSEFINPERQRDQATAKQKALPPTEPIDFSPEAASAVPSVKEPPVSQPAETKKTTASIKKTTTQKPRTELDNYLRGVVKIEGNHALILNNIRQLFPANQSDIILIDLSLGLLYYYSTDNEQLAVFPILTTPLDHFSKGLYKINKQELDPATDNHPSSRSLTMEKLVLDKNRRLLVENYYYLRDYFDDDQENSLSLSPVDNDKLQKMVRPETLLYIAR